MKREEAPKERYNYTRVILIYDRQFPDGIKFFTCVV